MEVEKESPRCVGTVISFESALSGKVYKGAGATPDYLV